MVRKHQMEDRKVSSPLPDIQNMFYERCLDFDEKLYTNHELAKQKLYPGSSVTILQAIFLRFKIFACHPFMSKEDKAKIFEWDSIFILPSNNKMPTTFRGVKQKIKQFLIKLEKYDTWRNNCLIYREAYAKDSSFFFL